MRSYCYILTVRSGAWRPQKGVLVMLSDCWYGKQYCVKTYWTSAANDIFWELAPQYPLRYGSLVAHARVHRTAISRQVSVEHRRRIEERDVMNYFAGITHAPGQADLFDE